MIIRERATVVQLYRSVYDPATKRSRTQYLGAFAKFGEPTAQLFAKLADSERQRLESFLAAQVAAREAIRGRYFFSDAPAQLRGVAAWLRRQQKSTEIRSGAKAIRDAYSELYAVMRLLGIARLRAGSARRAKRVALDSPSTGEAGVAADAATSAPRQDPGGVPEPAPAGAAQPAAVAPPAQR